MYQGATYRIPVEAVLKVGVSLYGPDVPDQTRNHQRTLRNSKYPQQERLIDPRPEKPQQSYLSQTLSELVISKLAMVYIREPLVVTWMFTLERQIYDWISQIADSQ